MIVVPKQIRSRDAGPDVGRRSVAARPKRLLGRLLCVLLALFVGAGITAIALFMAVVMPAQYKIQAAQICIPALQTAQTGDIVFFGTYEQDNDLSNGGEPIGWHVLDKQNDHLLLFSCYALDCVQFNTADAFATWDHCTLLEWLNDTFFDTAFSGAEKTLVLPSEVDVDFNPYFDTDPGGKTTEKVFIMSISETYKYLGTEEIRQCKPTAYTVARGVRVDNTGRCMWWLRTPGYDASAATRMLTDGSINFCGYRVHSDFNAVRPCIRVSLRPDTAA